MQVPTEGGGSARHDTVDDLGLLRPKVQLMTVRAEDRGKVELMTVAGPGERSRQGRRDVVSGWRRGRRWRARREGS